MTRAAPPQIVGVIFSRADLERALRLRNRPDLFELRLDALGPGADLSRAAEKLRAPLIITARHPLEGGANELSLRQRRDLLFQFLPAAAYLDIELRSARALTPLLKQAGARNTRTILSIHDFTKTPTRARLHSMARAARSLGANIFKVATRTETRAELERLLDLLGLQDAKMKVAVMGMGRLGRTSRVQSALRGSALSYVGLGESRVPGQLSLIQLRRALKTNLGQC